MISSAVPSPTHLPQFSEHQHTLDQTHGNGFVPSAEQRLGILERVFDSAPVGLCFLDLDYTFITLNERFARMNGLAIDSFWGRNLQDRLPLLAAQLTARQYQITGPKGFVEVEVTLERPSSSANQQSPEKLVYLWSSQPIRDPQGVASGYSIALMDITLRKRYESSLRDKEEYYRRAVELNPNIFWSSDPSGLNPYISPRFLKLTGLTKQEATQEWQRGCVHPEDVGPASQAWAQSLQNKTPYDSTYRVRDAAGAWRWLRVRAVPCLNTSGEVLRWYGAMEDIHDRKLLEEARESKILRFEEARRKQTIPFREDALTGLFNRRHFEADLQNEIVRARRSGQHMALVMLDVDSLGRYNDDYGYSAGDQCIIAIGRRLGRVLRRQADFAARYEGGTFAMLLPDTNHEGAMLAVRRAQADIQELAIPHHASSTGFITASIGVALFIPTQIRNVGGIDVDTDTEKLLRSAQSALSSAKAGGRNRIVTVKAL